MSNQTFGVTPPISVANPTAKENELNDLLIKELKQRGSFESETATKKRVEVLNILQKMTEDFVFKVSIKKNMSEGWPRMQEEKFLLLVLIDWAFMDRVRISIH